jgi:hypothetical protein
MAVDDRSASGKSCSRDGALTVEATSTIPHACSDQARTAHSLDAFGFEFVPKIRADATHALLSVVYLTSFCLCIGFSSIWSKTSKAPATFEAINTASSR